MPKRKHRKDKSHLRRKIRRLEERLRRCESDSSTDEEYQDHDRYYSVPRDRGNTPMSDEEIYSIIPLSGSDASIADPEVKSVVATPTNPGTNPETSVKVPAEQNVDKNSKDTTSTGSDPTPTTNTTSNGSDPTPTTNKGEAEVPLPADILEALGEPKSKDEVFGPKIPEEIAKRWGRVLVDGLTKEQKQENLEKFLVPDNFRIVKAPLLNPEVTPVLSESARHRDKLLEKSQNQLGLGISGLTNLAKTVIEGDLNKIEILRKISEVSQIFLDLHHEDTKRRRKLVTASLDKKILNMISDVKRDAYLFGVDLGEKIKATKTAERSGLQIKRNEPSTSTSRKYPQQGNWRGPPKPQAQRAHRQGGLRNKYSSQYYPSTSRRAPPAPERASRAPPSAPKTSAKTRKAP